MASWSEVEAQAPELTARARVLFDAFIHKTMATLRRDGSPRISGTEVVFRDGELYIGSMWRAVKALDLQRDPRFALHSGSADPPGWSGDAKIAGRFVEETAPDGDSEAGEGGESGSSEPSHSFRADITELVVVRLGEPADHLVIESWHDGRRVSSVKRY